MKPAPAGTRLLPYAGQTPALADEARGAASPDAQPEGVLTIGAMESITAGRNGGVPGFHERSACRS